MEKHEPTAEQLRVIHHESGHSRVLAVAGSGKTTTMVLRMRHLMRESGVGATKIRALMFNRLASNQFKEKLAKVSTPGQSGPFVSTFHSFAYQFMKRVIQNGQYPKMEMWTGDLDEKRRRLMVQTIEGLERRNQIPNGAVDSEQALRAVGLWKGALIPPERAGHRVNAHIPLVYTEFEKRRIRENALTFDDFVPITVKLLENEKALRGLFCDRYEHVIVDEYQDVNFGQQRLVELIAGDEAEVMVVGDDDQTIYEWRGARPDYIIREFEVAFPRKRHTRYYLTTTFRFGPVLAQAAQNAISLNANRQEKSVVANRSRLPTSLEVRADHSEQPTGVYRGMATEIIRLVTDEGVEPKEIWALGRMFAQLDILEIALLAARIPYRVLGRAPFLERTEVQKLVSYLLAAEGLRRPTTRNWSKCLLAVLNTPNRKLSKKVVAQAVQTGIQRGMTGAAVLEALIDGDGSPLSKARRDELRDLDDALRRAHEKLNEPDANAGMVLRWVVDRIGLEEHYRDYYGKGETSLRGRAGSGARILGTPGTLQRALLGIDWCWAPLFGIEDGGGHGLSIRRAQRRTKGTPFYRC